MFSENLFDGCLCGTDKFTVASFLEALEDSVAKASGAGDKDSESQRGSGNDPMDES